MSQLSQIFLLHQFLHLYHQICSDYRYNKRDIDFSSLREYNDYLEQVEEIGKAAELEAF